MRHGLSALWGVKLREEAQGLVIHPLATGEGKSGRVNDVNLCVKPRKTEPWRSNQDRQQRRAQSSGSVAILLLDPATSPAPQRSLLHSILRRGARSRERQRLGQPRCASSKSGGRRHSLLTRTGRTVMPRRALSWLHASGCPCPAGRWQGLAVDYPACRIVWRRGSRRRGSATPAYGSVEVTAAQLAGRLPAIGIVRRWSQSLALTRS